MVRLLDVNQLSAKWSIKRGTLYQWVSRGKIPFVKLNGLTRFDEVVLDRWYAEQEEARKRRNYEI